MPQVEKTVLVMHSADKMFGLVDAVEDYPQFLPWCGGTNLLARDETTTKATIHINYHGIKQSFTTLNTKQIPKSMLISLVDGPFKQLNGEWQFVPLQANACKIIFKLNYEFANSMLDKMIAPVFSHIANTFVDSFVKRADSIQKDKNA